MIYGDQTLVLAQDSYHILSSRWGMLGHVRAPCKSNEPKTHATDPPAAVRCSAAWIGKCRMTRVERGSPLKPMRRARTWLKDWMPWCCKAGGVGIEQNCTRIKIIYYCTDCCTYLFVYWFICLFIYDYICVRSWVHLSFGMSSCTALSIAMLRDLETACMVQNPRHESRSAACDKQGYLQWEPLARIQRTRCHQNRSCCVMLCCWATRICTPFPTMVSKSDHVG